MSYGDEKIIVDVKDVADGAIQYVDADSKSHIFSPGKTVWFSLTDLEENTAAMEPDDAHPEPWVQHYITGEAETNQHYNISVVGAADTSTRTLPFTIKGGYSKQDALECAIRSDGNVDFGRIGVATIGFMSSDWKAGSKASWWVECYTSQGIFDDLAYSVRAGNIRTTSFCLQSFRYLYSTEHWLSPISSRGNLFLRPNMSDNSLTFPQPAHGNLSALNVRLGSSRVGEPAAIASENAENAEEGAVPTIVTAPDPSTAALTMVIMHLEKLRKTVRWVAIAVGTCAFALLSK